MDLLPVYTTKEYQDEFDPQEYLDHFYSEKALKNGPKTALFALPVYLRRIATYLTDGMCHRLLDVGSGPTIYSALCARDMTKEIYLTDYTQSSLRELRQWCSKTSTFDWRPVVRCVAMQEGRIDYDIMERQARDKIKGVYFCDVNLPGLISDPRCAFKSTDNLFDVIITIFCLESACTNIDQYKKAMANIVAKLKPGGFFILGSVLEDTIYEFGKTRFELLYLTEGDILDAMEGAGLDVTNKFAWENEGAYMIMCQKPL